MRHLHTHKSACNETHAFKYYGTGGFGSPLLREEEPW